jgi:hypothetical protein
MPTYAASAHRQSHSLPAAEAGGAKHATNLSDGRVQRLRLEVAAFASTDRFINMLNRFVDLTEARLAEDLAEETVEVRAIANDTSKQARKLMAQNVMFLFGLLLGEDSGRSVIVSSASHPHCFGHCLSNKASTRFPVKVQQSPDRSRNTAFPKSSSAIPLSLRFRNQQIGQTLGSLCINSKSPKSNWNVSCPTPEMGASDTNSIVIITANSRTYKGCKLEEPRPRF